MKVAIVHDWLVSYRGGEKVLEVIASLFPDAPIYTLFYEPKALPKSLTQRQVRAPKSLHILRRFRKALLPFLPAFIESLPLGEYDLIISTSSCVAKGIIPAPAAKHLCYLHSPMRYIWDQREIYQRSIGPFSGLQALMQWASVSLRQWDVVSSARVDDFIVNSSFVGQRVKRYYGRSSRVLHPPIDTEFFSLPSSPSLDKPYFLVAGAFVAYKGFDLAIHACERLGLPLIVAGAGGEEKKWRKIAGRFTNFVIAPDDANWRRLLQGAQALIFPGVEDFGMTALEAMACGTPVLAYKMGGALDFIRPGETGLFFEEPTVESLSACLQKFSHEHFNPAKIRSFAEGFSKEKFLAAFQQILASYL